MRMKKFAFFDFNGTLTENNNSFNFFVEDNKSAIKRFIYNHFGFIPIIRKLGVHLTAKKLKKKCLTKQEVIKQSEQIILKKDTTTLLNTLKNLGYTIVIISGGFYEVIEVALNSNIFLVDHIFANNLIFNSDVVSGIKINDCDFEEKKKIILKLTNNNEEIIKNSIFVCNNFNDRQALKLPMKKFSFNKKIQNKNTMLINSLLDVLKFV